jgi:hypothetical protein
MNVPNSLGDTIVLADDDGTVTILEPLEDPYARMTAEERQVLLDYLERTRKIYRRGPTVTETSRPSQNMRADKIEGGEFDLEVTDINLTDDDDDPPPQVPLRTGGPRSPKNSGPANTAALPPSEPDEPGEN